MKVIHFDEAESYEPHKDWKRVSLCNEAAVSVEYFVKPPRHASPLHHHPQQQVCIVIKGKMSARTGEGEPVILEEGDAAIFGPDEPHVVQNELDEPSVGIDIFAPGRSFDFWLKRK